MAPFGSGGTGRLSLAQASARCESHSQGVIGMEDFAKRRSGAAALVGSSPDNVRLDGGAQLILRSNSPLSWAARKAGQLVLQ